MWRTRDVLWGTCCGQHWWTCSPQHSNCYPQHAPTTCTPQHRWCNPHHISTIYVYVVRKICSTLCCGYMLWITSTVVWVTCCGFITGPWFWSNLRDDRLSSHGTFFTRTPIVPWDERHGTIAKRTCEDWRRPIGRFWNHSLSFRKLIHPMWRSPIILSVLRSNLMVFRLNLMGCYTIITWIEQFSSHVALIYHIKIMSTHIICKRPMGRLPTRPIGIYCHWSHGTFDNVLWDK